MIDAMMNNSDPKRLARLMRLGAADQPIWLPEDLVPMLHHQLDVPMALDASADDDGAHQPAPSPRSRSTLLQSVWQVLADPQPSLNLLRRIKQFAKAYWKHPDGLLPQEIVLLLYFASISAALVRCGERITALDDVALRSGIVWLLEQRWVQEPIRGLLEAGLDRLPAPARGDGVP